MFTTSYLGAYWGGREESADECADRLADCFSHMSKADGALERWFRKGGGNRAARASVDVDGLVDLLRDGINRRDMTGEFIDGLGFSVALWNRASPSVTLGGTVGASTNVEGILNNFVLDVVPRPSDVPRMYDLDVGKNVFTSVVSAWSPDWATWTSHPWREIQNAQPRQPVVGWMTYVSAELDSELPGAVIEPFESGSIVTLSGDPGNVTTEDILALRLELASRGALAPID